MKARENIRLRWFLTIGITVFCVYLGFRYILPLLIPFIIAYFLAWIIRPMTEFLYKKFKMKRIIGGTISLLILTAVAGIGLFYLFNTLLKQAVKFIRNIPVYLGVLADQLEVICESCDELFGLTNGTARGIMDENLNQAISRVKYNLLPNLTEQTVSFTIRIFAAVGVIVIVWIATVLIAKDLPDFKEKYKHHDLFRDFHRVSSKLADAGIAYLRSQAIIMSIIAVICVIGLTILGSDYALLLGIGIALFDALPVLGSALILIPWSIIMLINGNIYAAAVLISIFLVCQIIREILEPRLIGHRIGIKPLYTLISIYIGVKLFSVIGFVLGPIGLIMIITIVKVISEKSEEANTPDVFYNGD